MTEHVGEEPDRKDPEFEEWEQGYEQGKSDHENKIPLGDRDAINDWNNRSATWRRGWGAGYEDAAQPEEVNAYDIPVTDVTVQFTTGVSRGDEEMSLGDAANIAAVNLIRVGLDGYSMLYTDVPTGRQWIAKDGAFVAVEGSGADPE